MKAMKPTMNKSVPGYGKYLFLISLFLSLVVIVAFSGYLKGEEALKVSLNKTEIPDNQAANSRPVRIGVFAMASPRVTMGYYQDFLSYLSEDTGLEFELVQRDNPAEINYLLETRYLDAVFVREDDYIKGHEDFGMDIIAVPIFHGGLGYYSYVIARPNEGIDGLEDLRNKRFAFNSYRFNRGDIVPDYMRQVINESPGTFFSSYIYSNSQDNFINMIASGTLDGAEIDCIMWSYIVADSPTDSSSLKIVYTSPPQLVPAIAFHPDMDQELRTEIKTSLLKMQENPQGQGILKDMHFDMFVEMDHNTYAAYNDGSQRIG